MHYDYTDDYVVIIPRLKNKQGKPAQVNPKLGDWPYDFDRDALKKYGLHAMAFNFFILWNESKSDGELYDNVWLKRELRICTGNVVNLKDRRFDSKLTRSVPENEMDMYRQFLKVHAMSTSFIVLKDLQEEPIENDRVAAEIYVKDDGSFAKRVLSYQEFKELLIERSNGQFRMGKELVYSETELERYLAARSRETGAVFPGDCDMLLYDEQYQCLYILEFKKCTKSGMRIPVEQQSLMRYITKDRSKYMRLNILRLYFEKLEQKEIPLITVFYPTTDETVIKLEAVKNNLTPGLTKVYEMRANPKENSDELLAQIVRNYSHEQRGQEG